MRRLLLILAGLCLANFIVYTAVAIHLGGDAINGYAKGGQYFVVSRGRATEVSEAIFEYNRWHTYSVWLTHPLGMIAVAFRYFLPQSDKASVP
jgi:hypothetical protein